MEIIVTSGFGRGKTLLSAFDRALQICGVYNYNLITLSSIIPKGSKITKVNRYKPQKEEYGYKLYAVKWDVRSREAGKVIAAGLGWYQTDDGSGVFVEHDASGYNLKRVEKEIMGKIDRSVRDLCTFRNIPFEKPRMNYSIAIGKVQKEPSCALAIAAFKVESWE